jgi:hypothetical protein
MAFFLWRCFVPLSYVFMVGKHAEAFGLRTSRTLHKDPPKSIPVD